MLELARNNAAKAGASNASFIEASITRIPLPDSTADCIISNCVVNLVPATDKHLVFKEMFRLLKPGGRVAISDILARKELPAEVARNLSLYVGCIAGASRVHEYEEYLQQAGFNGECYVLVLLFAQRTDRCLDVVIVDTQKDLNTYKWMLAGGKGQGSCCGQSEAGNCGNTSEPSELSEEELVKFDFNDWTGK